MRHQLVMDILSMVTENILEDSMNIVLTKICKFMHHKKYTAAISKSVMVTLQQIGISVHNIHTLVFTELYNPVELTD